MIRSCVNAGLVRAKARSVKLGRQPKVGAKVEAAVSWHGHPEDREDGGRRQRHGKRFKAEPATEASLAPLCVPQAQWCSRLCRGSRSRQ